MKLGRGGACVTARVALQGRIRRSFPVHDACVFGMETPARGRSGGHIGTAPTISFGQIARGTGMSFGRIARGCSPLRFRLGRLRMKRLMPLGWIVCKWLFCLCGMRGKI